MERTENLIMQEDRWKPLKEMNLTDDFLFDVATAELENCKTIIELSTGLRLKSLKWKEGQKVIHNIPGKRGIRMDFVAESEDGRVFDVEMQNRKEENSIAIRLKVAARNSQIYYLEMRLQNYFSVQKEKMKMKCRKN